METATPLPAAATNSAFFRALDDDARRMLAARSRVVERGAGSVIWRWQQPVDCVALVLSGRCKLRREEQAVETILDVLCAGDLAGDLAFATGAYQSDLVTLRRASLLLMPASALRSTAIASSLCWSLAEKLLRLYQRIEDLGAGSVQARVARLLVRLSERVGVPFPGGTLVSVRLRRQDLASMASTSLESVSRTLNKLDRQKVIRLQPVGFVVLQPELLRQAAALQSSA